MNVYANGEGLVEALNVRVYGNGNQTLVLSHGFGADQTVWHYILPCLAYYFKVVVFDMVFSGNVRPQVYHQKRYSNLHSYARDLTCLLDQLNVTSSIYLGHSMSAMIGCIAASQRPQLFKHLILLGGSPRYLNEEGYKGGFERSEVETIFHNMKSNFSNWVSAFSPVAIGRHDPNSIEEFKSSLGRMKPDIALDVARTVFLGDNREVLGKVGVPCTVIQSKKDPVVPTSVAFYMGSKLGGNSTVEILKTKGHLPMLTAYPLLLDVLKRVLGIRE